MDLQLIRKSIEQGANDSAVVGLHYSRIADELRSGDTWKYDGQIVAEMGADVPIAALLMREIRANELFCSGLKELRAEIVRRHASLTAGTV